MAVVLGAAGACWRQGARWRADHVTENLHTLLLPPLLLLLLLSSAALDLTTLLLLNQRRSLSVSIRLLHASGRCFAKQWGGDPGGGQEGAHLDQLRVPVVDLRAKVIRTRKCRC